MKMMIVIKTKSKLIKLHKQFGHAYWKMQVIQIQVDNMVGEISNNCDVSKKYKVPPKPVVGLSRATDFNQSVY